MFLYGEESLEPYQTPNLETLSFICNLQMCHVVVGGTHYHCGTDTPFILLFIRNQRGRRWHRLQGHFLAHNQWHTYTFIDDDDAVSLHKNSISL